MYYRQKGQRTPTRPQAIHENFDLCAEALVQRLTSYKTQSEEYHNSCIQGERVRKKTCLFCLCPFGKNTWARNRWDNVWAFHNLSEAKHSYEKLTQWNLNIMISFTRMTPCQLSSFFVTLQLITCSFLKTRLLNLATDSAKKLETIRLIITGVVFYRTSLAAAEVLGDFSSSSTAGSTDHSRWSAERFRRRTRNAGERL